MRITALTIGAAALAILIAPFMGDGDASAAPEAATATLCTQADDAAPCADLPRKSYHVGLRLPDDVVAKPVPLVVRETLGPPPRGFAYVQVDGDILLIQLETRQVTQTMVTDDAARKLLDHYN